MRALLVLPALALAIAGCGAPDRAGRAATAADGAGLAEPDTVLATSFALPGISAPVRIVQDRWGIPHVRAANLSDLYFAWGFTTARDRLWQMLYNRQSADGQLWRWFGNSTLRADGGAQLFELRSFAERGWERL